MLSGKKDFLVTEERFFERPDAGLAPDHKRSHHIRKNDDVPDGHHGQSFRIRLIFGGHHLSNFPGDLRPEALGLENDNSF